jgi:hypothetical protein
MSVSRTQTVLAAGGLAALLAAGSVAIALSGRPSPSGTTGRTGGTARIGSVAFTGFDDCAALLGYYRSHGHDLVGPYGLPDGGVMTADGVATVPMPVARSGLPVPAAGSARMAVPDSAAGSAASGSAASGSAAAGSAASGSAASGSGAAVSGQPDTGTNVQVAGVDEADVAKRSGDLLLTVAAPPSAVMYPMATGAGAAVSNSLPGSTGTAVPPGLRLLRTSGIRATLVGVLPTTGWAPNQLLVKGSTVLLLGPAPSAPAGPGDRVAVPYLNRTRIVQVDIADPAHPRLLRTLDVDGGLVGARLSAGVARIAVSGSPGNLPFVTPQSVTPQAIPPATPDSAPGAARSAGSAPAGSARGTAATPGASPTERSEADALAANRKLIAESSLDQWLPQYTLAEGSGLSTTSSGRLLDCTKVAAPAQFSGLNTLALLTFDLTRPAGIGSWNSAGVVAAGATMYATADRTYLTTSPWRDWSAMPEARRVQAEQQQRTWIHAFDTAGSGSPRYLASGSVPGFLLNQYAMDEYRGVLRVASTVHPSRITGSATVGSGPVPAPGRSTPAPDSSQITALRVDGDRLAAVGSVGGIGRGEQIRAVRFIGPVGYVVTFRQTDPLFTVDLSDPARPRVAGELHLLGYSAYLHPAGDGRLLGVGQSADPNGVRQGLQLSLFDVSNPAAPRRLAQVGLPGAFSETESTSHAFTYVDGLVLVPYSRPVPVPNPLPRYGSAPQPNLSPGTGGAPDYVLGMDAGVLAVRVTGNGLSAPAELHPLGPSASAVYPQGMVTGRGYRAGAPLRTFVGGGAIWTVTLEGVSAHQESTFRWLSYTPFPR